MAANTIVLGGDIVGVSVAWHLARAGLDVCLIDRQQPHRGTSYGCAGLIHREGVGPPFAPPLLHLLGALLGGGGSALRVRASALGLGTPSLLALGRSATARRRTRLAQEYAPLIEQCTAEHAELIKAAGAESLIDDRGWLELHRHPRALARRAERARRLHARHGVEFAALCPTRLAMLEPGISAGLAGAIRWRNAWTVSDPGALVAAYVASFRSAGGEVIAAEAQAFHRTAGGWSVRTSAGPVEARHLVLALGPWSGEWTRQLGYRLPLLGLRGYHMHYAQQPPGALLHWLMDAEAGYFVAPMRQGIRLTTGVELAAPRAGTRWDAVRAAEQQARRLVPTMGQRIDAKPWLGSRPCMPDMKPVIGPAPRHRGLWLAFGHGFHGLTLGPVTGRLLAQLMLGQRPLVDPGPFSPARYGL